MKLRALSAALAIAAIGLAGCTSDDPRIDGPIRATDGGEREKLDKILADKLEPTEAGGGGGAGADSNAQVHDLPSEKLRELLTLLPDGRSQDPPCSGKDVAISFGEVNAALGTRFQSMIVENTSTHPCGLGARIGMGSATKAGEKLTPEADFVTVDINAQELPVRGRVLQPGERAQIALKWSGSLVGNYEPHTEAFVIQFAENAEPFALVLPEPIEDLGTGTSFTLRPWQDAEPR